MTRRTSAATAAGLAIAAVAAAGGLTSPARAAALGTATPTPASIPNTATAQVVTISNSFPVVGAQVQLVGPATLGDTYTGTETSSSGTSTKFNLDPTNLPAAPGVYALNVCALSCPIPSDSGSMTVTGAAPVPHAPVTPFQVLPGNTISNFALAGTGFAKDETLSISRPGGSASDVTFTENNTTSTATSLAGTLAAGASVPNGIYELDVTDTAGHVGSCAGCLQVGPGFPVTSLSATPVTANVATVSWKPPAGGPTLTSYKVVVSKTSQTTTDPGITVNVDQAHLSATISGLTGSTTYFVTVTGTNGTTTSPPAFTKLNTPNPTALSLRASRSSLVAGNSVDLSGVLVHKVGSNPSSGMAHQTVVITGKSDFGKVSKVGTTTTNSHGEFKFTAFPTTNTAYGAYFAGAPGSGGTPDAAAISNAFPRVTVAPLIVAAPQHSKIRRHTKTVLVLGFVTPNERGRIVHLVRIDGTGTVHDVAHARLTSSSHYSVRGRVPKTPGRYSFQVRITKRVGNLAGKSRVFHVTRRK
jgi:hypothetical protein